MARLVECSSGNTKFSGSNPAEKEKKKKLKFAPYLMNIKRFFFSFQTNTFTFSSRLDGIFSSIRSKFRQLKSTPEDLTGAEKKSRKRCSVLILAALGLFFSPPSSTIKWKVNPTLSLDLARFDQTLYLPFIFRR